MSKKEKNLRSWVEIDGKALRHNFDVFHDLLARSIRITHSGQAMPMLMCIIKSNAYGHGVVECARIFENVSRLRDSSGEPSWFGVDDIDEALTLRKTGIKLPILVLGYTLPTCYTEAVRRDISVTVSSIESLKHSLKIEN